MDIVKIEELLKLAARARDTADAVWKFERMFVRQIEEALQDMQQEIKEEGEEELDFGISFKSGS